MQALLAYSIGPTEIIIVVAVVALLFGAKKIPELARNIGRSQSEFKRGMKEGESPDDEASAEQGSETKTDTTADKTTD